MSSSGHSNCPPPAVPAVSSRPIFSNCTYGLSSQEDPNISVDASQDSTLNSSDTPVARQARPRALSHLQKDRSDSFFSQDRRWSTNDVRAMIRIFETYAGPFAVGTVAELLDRAGHAEVGKWIILHRQSAHALSVSEAKRATGARRRPKIAPPYCLPIACPLGGGVTTVIGGIDDFKLRVYLDGSLTGSFGLQLPETKEE